MTAMTRRRSSTNGTKEAASRELSGGKREGSDGKSSKRFNFRRHRKESRAQIGHRIETSKMLDDWNTGTQQHRMDGACKIGGIINIQRINTNKSSSRVTQPVGGRAGQERMPFKILIRAPVAVPARSHQYSFSGYIQPLKEFAADRPLSRGHSDHDAVQVREMFQRQLRQVQALGV